MYSWGLHCLPAKVIRVMVHDLLFTIFSPVNVSHYSLVRREGHMDTYSRLLVSRFGDISENAQDFYLFTGSSSQGSWIQGFEPVYTIPFCSALESSSTLAGSI